MLPYTLIDLTHPLTPEAPTWEGECGFFLKTRAAVNPLEDSQFCVQEFSLKAGFGTHMDAPRHCFIDQKSVADFDIKDLIALAVILDISKKVRIQPSAQLTTEDIFDFERHYGLIEEGSIALISSGWDKRWHDPVSYRNDMIFPTIAHNAAELLRDRGCRGVGIDTLSPDLPDSGYPVHKSILSANGIILENVANLENMPPKGGLVLISPLRIIGAAESPIRLIGLIKKDRKI